MTFVNKKIRVFYDRGDIKPERRRSEARLKKYGSSIDIRSWCDVVEDRRQHILELITKGYGKCRQSIIPLDIIIDAALYQKNTDIRDIQKCMNQMWSFVGKVNLNDEDKTRLIQLKQEMNKKCLVSTTVRKLSSVSDIPDITKSSELETPLKNMRRKMAKKKEIVERARVSEYHSKPNDLENDNVTEDEGIKTMKYKVKSAGPAKVTTKIYGLKEGFKIKTVPIEISNGKKTKKIITNAYPNELDNEETQHSPEHFINQQITTVPVVTSTKEPEGKHTTHSEGKDSKQSEEKDSKHSEEKGTKEPETKPTKGSTHIENQSRNIDIIYSKRKNEITDQKLDGYSSDHPKKNHAEIKEGDKIIGVNENLGKELMELKDQLAAREALCNEQSMNIDNLKNERDKLKKKIEDCLKDLEELKNLNNVSNPMVSTSCKEEIDALEREIKIMRSGNSSPEEEASVIQKEVEILMKYCMKLKEVENENKKLKKEISSMKTPELMTEFPPIKLTEESNAVNQKKSDKKVIENPSTKMSQNNNVDESNIEKMKETMKEGDPQSRQLKQMRTEMFRVSNQYDESSLYSNKAEMLDNVLAERDELKKQLEKMKGIEKENENLRKNMGKAEQQPSTQKFKGKADFTDLELRKSLSRCGYLEKENQNLRKERDVMTKRIEVMKSEVETLRSKAKEAEMLKLERDKLQIKLNDLSHVQIHNENLMLKCKCLENALTERDTYKQKYEDILSMECQCDLLRNQTEENKSLVRDRDSLRKQTEDLKTCIHEQEDEIKRLMSNIDDLMRNKEEAQSRMKDALANMRTEIDKKDSIIALSEERLASVQTQLKSSIQGVSCETICYKTRIDELERELSQSHRTIKSLQKQTKDHRNINNQDLVENMKKELAAAKKENGKLQDIAKQMVLLTGDEHVQKMLKQSECAVKKVVEELGKQYKEWDLIKNQQNYLPSSKEHIYATRNDLRISGELEMKTELEDIRKEKEKLERIVAEIQNEKYARSSQKITEFLKLENEKLKNQLNKEIELRKTLEQKIHQN